jgi:hypothetical protein
VNVADVCPAGMVTAAGTVSSLASFELSRMTRSVAEVPPIRTVPALVRV